MFRVSSSNNHLFIHGDSSQVEYERTFDLVLTSPPFFHPSRRKSPHGFAPTTDLDQYVRYVSAILVKAASGLRDNRFVCIVKTDLLYKRTLIPVGFKLATECNRNGLLLLAHWVWRRYKHYTPYSPSFANIFLFGKGPYPCPYFNGIFSDVPIRRQLGLPNSYTPEIFESLIRTLTRQGAVILDPFAGAGSVLEAAATSGRWSVGIEISRSQLLLAKVRLPQTAPGVIFRTISAGSSDVGY